MMHVRLLAACLTAAFFFMPAFSAAHAQPEILGRAYKAHGADTLAQAETLEIRVRIIDTWVNQDIKPGPPWDRSSGYRWHGVDFENLRHADQRHTVNAGFYAFYDRIVTDGEDGFRINLLEQNWYPLTGGEDRFHARTQDAKIVLPAWLVLDAMDDPDVEMTGQAAVDGRTLARVEAQLADGTQATLYFDPETALLARLEREGNPAVLAYGGYEERAGLMVPQQMGMIYQGHPVLEYEMVHLELNADIEDMFARPGDIPMVEVDNDPEARAFKVQELDPGIWFVGEAVFYQLFVEFDDFLVAVGGIGGDVDRRLATVHELTGKPLRYAIVTHHHSDHLDGVPAMAEAGATIIVAEGNQYVTREALGNIEADIETVVDFRTITGGEQRLDIYQIGPGSHADAMLAAYLPREKVLYTGDLLVQPPGRPMRARIPPIQDLVIAIETFGLDVERHLDPHSPRITSLEEIYEAFHN